MIWTLLLLAIWSVEGTDWYHSYWCGDKSLQYLHDGNCVKKFPTNYNREWTCPVPIVSEIPEGFEKDNDLSKVKVDTTALTKYVKNPDVNVCVVVTKRVADKSNPQGFSLYNRYFCAGDKSATERFQTWSSSKIFAMANAAGHLRSNETKCGSGDTHNQLFGLDGSVIGKHGTTPFGDLATVVCSYDTTSGYSSNSVSSYFHDIGWRDRINDLLQNWLTVPSSQTLGGNYGEATPSDLGFIVTEPVGTCSIDKDPWPITYSNMISSLTEVELIRRIALHRELAENFRFPGVAWADIQNMLYGSDSSALFPGLKWGGMSTDIAVFFQSTDKVNALLSDEKYHRDQWRIFSKLGNGWFKDGEKVSPSADSQGEIISNVYSCLPHFDAKGHAIGGYEMAINVRGSVYNDSSLKKVEAAVLEAMQQTVNFVFETFQG